MSEQRRRGPKPKPFLCSDPVFWYLVGLIATDGCLIRDGRSINITAKDREFLAQGRIAIGSMGRISRKFGSMGQLAHQLQFKSRSLWNRLWDIGLTPRKSLTIGALRVPDEWFRDFLRGVIDGDGNIRRWIHPSNGREQWTVRIVSGSKPFLSWLQETANRLWCVTGGLHVRPPASERHHPLYTLKFGKIAAKVLLTECYYPNALALERKRALAIACVTAAVGWSQSKTARDPNRWRAWNYVHVYVRKPRPVISENEDVDPTAGLVAEKAGIYGRGGETWRNALGLKPSGAKAPCGFDSHPRHDFSAMVGVECRDLPRNFNHGNAGG